MRRLARGSLTSALNLVYLDNLTKQINHITSKGNYAMLQPHDYGEGNAWRGAWTWASSENDASLINAKDPKDKPI